MDYPNKGPVMQIFDEFLIVFIDMLLNKQSSKTGNEMRGLNAYIMLS